MPVPPSSPFAAKDEGENGSPNDDGDRVDNESYVVGVVRDRV